MILLAIRSSYRQLKTFFIQGISIYKPFSSTSQICMSVPVRQISIKSLHQARCYELFYEYIIEELWCIDGCFNELFKMLYKPGHCAEVVLKHSVNSTSTDHLFDQEDNSIYAEQYQKAVHLHSTLKLCIHKRMVDGLLVEFANVDLDELKEECGVVVNKLTENSQDKPVFNLSGNNAVVPAITCLCLALDVLIDMNLSGHHHQQLCHSLQRIQQIPNLHPAIVSILCVKCKTVAEVR